MKIELGVEGVKIVDSRGHDVLAGVRVVAGVAGDLPSSRLLRSKDGFAPISKGGYQIIDPIERVLPPSVKTIGIGSPIAKKVE